MKSILATMFSILCAVGCTSIKNGDSPAPEFVGGCSHDHELPPLTLEAADKQLLASRSSNPRKASDYYFALPSSYFSIIENSPERRATFVQKDTMSDSFIHAERSFECDGGGFDVTMRVFDTPNGPLVGISSSTYEATILYSDTDPGPGELESITVHRPQFWRYAGGKWVRVSDSILPMITRDFVLDRYRNHYKAHLENAKSDKFIWLSYDLPPSGNEINVTGRENFMDPFETYVWRRFAFNGESFTEKTKTANKP
jgi:hypothetical protein